MKKFRICPLYQDGKRKPAAEGLAIKMVDNNNNEQEIAKVYEYEALFSSTDFFSFTELYEFIEYVKEAQAIIREGEDISGPVEL